MAKKTVLAIGIEPSLVDFSAFPELTTELVTSYIKASIQKLARWDMRPIAARSISAQTAEAVAAAALGAKLSSPRGDRRRPAKTAGAAAVIRTDHLSASFGALQVRIAFNINAGSIRREACGDGVEP